MVLYFRFRALVEPPCRTLAMEVGLDPRIWVLDDAIERIDFHTLVDNHPDTIAGPEDGVQIVRDHDDSEPQLLLKIQYQLVELGGADRIQARGGLIEKQQARIECQRAGEGRPLDHAAGQL